MASQAGVELQASFECEVDVGTARARCRVEALQTIDRRCGKVVQESPMTLSRGDAVICSVRPLEMLALEAHADVAALGKLCLRQDGAMLGVGVVESVQSEQCVLLRYS